MDWMEDGMDMDKGMEGRHHASAGRKNLPASGEQWSWVCKRHCEPALNLVLSKKPCKKPAPGREWRQVFIEAKVIPGLTFPLVMGW